MFILNNTLCNGDLYERGQKVDKKDDNFKQLEADGLLVDKNPDEVATIVGSDSKELTAALEDAANKIADLEKALAEANDKANALENDKAKLSQDIADIAEENAKLTKALAEATK